MINMKKLTSIYFFLLLAMLAGCTKDFEKINTNRNESETLPSPSLLLPNLMREAFNASLNTSYQRGVIAGDLVYNDFSSNYNNWVRADASGYFLWSNYDYIRELNDVIAISEANNTNNYKGLALVLRAFLFQNLTDLYGPIPFREASNAKLNQVYSPKYEQQEAVYQGLLQDLEEAINLFGSTGETISNDILFNGNIERWKKFATGLTIRLLIRQSKKVNPTTALTNIINNPSKYPLFASHQDQAALQYLAIWDNSVPLYRRSNSDYATSTRVSKNLIDNLKLLNDPRLPVYALPTQTSAAGNNPANFEYEGAVNAMGPLINPENYSAPGMLWAPLQYNSLASMTAAQSLLLTYSEVQFNLAEAAEKGYIPGGTGAAETHYLNGVKDQFEYYASRIGNMYENSFLALSAADVIPSAGYYTQPEVAYAGTEAEKLVKIARQKWLSLYFVGYEAWSEWRRTGFPEIVVGTQGPGYIARRVMYPADEMRINEDNYNQAVQWLGADDLKTRMWWDE